MATVYIDERTDIGKQILQELSDNPLAGKVKHPRVPLDENGVPMGTPWETVLDEMYDDLSKHYGVDLRTL
jgi:hypothetical protein